MELEQNSDLEEKDSQGIFVTDKELLTDIKSKVDLSNIFDVSLHSQDFTNGLNAEIDLDESVDKVDNLADENDGNDEGTIIDAGKLENSESEDCKTVNETGYLKEETVEDSVEFQADNSVDSNNKSDNRNSTDTVEQEETMGNNLERKEENDTVVEHSSDKLDQLSKENNEESENNEFIDKSENNNEKETQDNENLAKPEHSVNHETRDVQNQGTDTNGENVETVEIAEKLECDIDADAGVTVSSEEQKSEMQNEGLEVTEEENQEKYLEESNSEFEKDSVKEKWSVDGDVEDHEDRGKTEEEIIDREKIQNFIKEVINDLQGIVMETEECDSVVNDMCEDSTRSELVIDSEVKDEENENEEVLTTENTSTSKGDEATVTLEGVAIDTYNETLDTSLKNVADQDTTCELVIEENNDVTDTLDSSINIVEIVPRIDERTTNEDNTNEIGTEKSDTLVDTQESVICEEEHKGSSKELEVAVPTETAILIRRKENDIKMVEEELKATKAVLQKSQQSLQDECSKHNRDVMMLKLQLCRSQMDLKRQKSKSEKQLTEIMSHLMMLESRLRQEQLRLKREAREKNNLIEIQKNEIVKLRNQNDQLLNAIKEIYEKGGMNGYMRENKRKNGNNMDNFESNAKGNRDKKGHATGKLGSMKDKFMAKNRSSLELSNFSLEKYLIKDERMCSSQEDLHRLSDERRRSTPTIEERVMKAQRHDISPKNRPVSDSSEYKNGSHKKHVRYANQNFFSDAGSPQYEMNKSVSESSHLSESTNSSSGVYSLSDHDLSMHNDSVTNGHHGNHDFMGDDDDDDDRIFSFSSTHINTVIAEEEAMGPVMSHSGQMMSMGSMPMLANLKEENMGSGKNRPHSLSSVDLVSIQQQALNLARLENRSSPGTSPVTDKSTPPTSPSYTHGKNELTPFKTFKEMFRRKGSSKNKGHKKRSVSLSQTTNMEYSEALKKHFQKYDMS